MKISNFELVGMDGNNALNKVFYALVDVETGVLWWKKTERVGIRKEYASNWYFTETGEWCPGYDVDALARAWTAKTGQET